MITHEEELDQNFGKIGTPRRDRFEIRQLFWFVAREIVQRRREIGLSQEDLASLTGMNIKEIKSIERGAVTTPVPKIHKIWVAIVAATPIHKSKEKSSHKRTLTKQSSTMRTIVR